GVAGPDELEGKPVGTVYIGITDGEITRSIHVAFPQQRPRIKRYAAMGALFELRRLLLEKTHN
ncbi:MAG: CinA family protein, partial [Dehalococcoidia bacterium]|nr:CinA family protein [Dehalococcoidia bacterium]